MHTHRNIPYSCLLVRFSFSVVILCYSLSVLDLAFWDYLYLCAFVELDLISAVLCQEIGYEERLLNDPYCVEWDVKP